MDVVVVVGFSVALTAASALLGEGMSLGSLVAGVTVGLLLSLVDGLLVGGLLILVVHRVGGFRIAAVLLVGAAAASVILAVVAVQWAETRLEVHAEVYLRLAAADASRLPRAVAVPLLRVVTVPSH